jgi:hypothetical protein
MDIVTFVVCAIWPFCYEKHIEVLVSIYHLCSIVVNLRFIWFSCYTRSVLDAEYDLRSGWLATLIHWNLTLEQEECFIFGLIEWLHQNFQSDVVSILDDLPFENLFLCRYSIDQIPSPLPSEFWFEQRSSGIRSPDIWCRTHVSIILLIERCRNYHMDNFPYRACINTLNRYQYTNTPHHNILEALVSYS